MRRLVTAVRRSPRLAAFALVMVLVIVAQPIAAQDGVRRGLEALGMDIPAPPLAAPSFALPGLDGNPVRLS